MKKTRLICWITACLFLLSGCSILAESKPVDPETSGLVGGTAYSLVSQIFVGLEDPSFAQYMQDMSPEEIELQFESMGVYMDGEAMSRGVDSWINAQESLGSIQAVGDPVTEYNSKGDSIVVTVPVVGDKLNSLGQQRQAEVEFVFKDNYYKTMTSCATNVTLTFGEKMENAGLNTLIGMGTVFSILIVLCLIISLFGIFPKLEEKKRKKKEQGTPIDQPIAQIIAKEEMSSENDNLELVAVITAAIAAYESAGGEVTTDDFVVRSIKRRR
ncbi:MAG: OadG family protein [Lachnospiraceae bacterium]|nr:OadG family protein [Lachnospiraceae bacterium]